LATENQPQQSQPGNASPDDEVLDDVVVVVVAASCPASASACGVDGVPDEPGVVDVVAGVGLFGSEVSLEEQPAVRPTPRTTTV
jgi:hypothetical protein